MTRGREAARSPLAFALAALGARSAGARPAPPPAATAPFDYYVMALSWSPGFCDLGGDQKSPRQCAPGAGYGFVVHGLWPNNRFGADPEDCDPDADVSPAELAAAQRPLSRPTALRPTNTASTGPAPASTPPTISPPCASCATGSSIPPALQGVRAWLRMPPDGSGRRSSTPTPTCRPDNIAVTCARGQLVDVRICITKTLKAFATCPQVARNSCRRDSILVAPLR